MNEYEEELVLEQGIRLRHRHWLALLLLLVVIFLCVLVAGCTTSSGKSLYLVEIKYSANSHDAITETGIVNQGWYSSINNAVGDADVVTRIGYFGICTNSTALQDNAGGDWRCSLNASRLIDYFTIATQDPMNLVYLSLQLRSHNFGGWTIIVGTVLTAIDFFLVLMSRPTQAFAFPIASVVCALAFVFTLLGVAWQQVAAGTVATVLNVFTEYAVSAHFGTPTAGLGWTSVVFLFICLISSVLIHYNDKAAMLEGGEIVDHRPPMVEVAP